MAHEVFISYTSQNKTAADAVCAGLEREKLRCWIAPRDVLPGSNYGESIVNAIESARVVVLIFSSASNLSPAVQREMERAMHFGKPIIPFRLEDVPITKGMEFYLASCHWLDAMSPPIERHIGQLASAVNALLGNEWSKPAEPITPIKRSRRTLIKAMVLVGLTAALIAGGVLFMNRRPVRNEPGAPSARDTARSPTLTGISIDVQVRNSSAEPIREAFDSSPAAQTRVRYELSRDDKIVHLKPVCPYLQRLVEKDATLPMWTVSRAPHFEMTPVLLVVQLLNDTAKALSVNRIELQVSESESDDRPVPLFLSDSEGLQIINQGWAPIESATLQIKSPETARGTVALAKLEKGQLVRWSEMNKTANGTTAARELKGVLEYFWFAKDGVRHPAAISFQAEPDGSNDPAAPSDAARDADAPTPLQLEVDKSDYRVTGPLARQIAPGEHDVVEVAVAAPRSSHHRFHLLVDYNDGQDGVLRSPEVDLEFFGPRSAGE